MNIEEIKKTVSPNSGDMLKTLSNLWPYIWPHDESVLKRRVILALLCLIFSKIILIFVSYFFKYVTNALGGDTPQWLATHIVSPFMLVFAYNFFRISQAALNQLRDVFFASVGQHAVRKLARETFIHVHELSLRFHLKRRTGGLSRIIDRGIKGIEAIVRFTILNTAPTILECAITAFVFWLSYGWVYLAVVSLTIGFYAWFTIAASNWRIAIRRDMNASDTEANTQAIDSLLNFETVKYFSNEAMEVKHFDASMERYEQAAIKTWVSLGWLNFGQVVIFGLGMAVLMLISAYEVIQGQQTLGDFVFVNALLIQLSIPLNFIGSTYREIRQGLTDIEQMFDLLDVSQEIRDKPDAPDLKIKGGLISFNKVEFSYDPERQILKRISFEVPAGKKVAIVGPSGSGKSTISRLLFRFYDVQSGEVMIDRQDVRDVTQESLRKAIGMVPQDTVLFNNTIAYNIRYGKPDATDEEVWQAARLAQISHFIEKLPYGYETMVGERGLKLSGGEKQRIAIARTILKSPPILILDEATSALDTATEQDIQQALDLVSRNRTTLIIAHRLSTVVNADEILVLKCGRFIERGTHQQLLEKKGLYASMWVHQLETIRAKEKLREMRGKNKF
ncbi:MAG: ATP-binding cassette [Candidatus Tokpelaia sp. JSC188]|nr:MAG: ATP-binding cassette [Candidatus Tokpelaia sp. JSC188]